jgi:hypothetical protein
VERREAYTVVNRVCTSHCPPGRTRIRSTKEHVRGRRYPWASDSD